MQPQSQYGGQIPPPPPTPPASRDRGGRTSTVIGTLALVLSVVALVVSFAIPGPAGANGLNGTAGATGTTGATGPQGPPGMNATTLWAVVNANGTVARGSGVNAAGTASMHLSTGTYPVLFQNQVVINCAYSATIGLADNSGTASPGFITAQLGTYANEIIVMTYNTMGTLTDLPFNLAVFC